MFLLTYQNVKPAWILAQQEIWWWRFLWR